MVKKPKIKKDVKKYQLVASLKLPKIKKDVRSFLVGEEGKISKEKLMKTGIVVMAAAAYSLETSAAHSSTSTYYHTNSWAHSNAPTLTYASFAGSADHTNHASGESTDQHSSHDSHSNCCGSQVGVHW